MSTAGPSRPSFLTTSVAGAFFVGLLVSAGISAVLKPMFVVVGLGGLAVCLISTIVGHWRSRAAQQRACWRNERRLAYRLHRHVPIQAPNRRPRREAVRPVESQYLPVTSRPR